MAGLPPGAFHPLMKSGFLFLLLCPALLRAEESLSLKEMVVTASGKFEPAEDVSKTIRIFGEEELSESAPRQLTDFFHQRALGQVQEFGSAHATFFLRGFTTIGASQGWSDGSEVMVLINGRPSGTANIGKLSTHDIERVEIAQGSGSVLYGSSALGGVVNLITKNGGTFEGTEISTLFSSADRYTGIFQTGGRQGDFDYYLELNATNAGDYDTGRGSSGHQPNTGYDQRGATFALGYEINRDHRLDFTFRQDGMYDAGHPGSAYSQTDYDDRYGTSLQLDYHGATTDGRFRWENRSYWLRDVDDLHWSQNPLIGLIPRLTAPALIGSPGITRDVNERELQEWGNRFSLQADLVPHNTLTIGLDLRLSELENHRERTAAPGYLGGLIGIPVTLPPLSVDARTLTTGLYLLDSHSFLDEKLKVTLGGRYDQIRQETLPTQNTTIREETRKDDIFVWESGLTYAATRWLVLRANAATGYLAPNPTQLHGNTMQANGYRFAANPDLKDEKSFGWDIGGTVRHGDFLLDLSFFQNTIHDNFVPYRLPGTATLQWRNSDERMVRGIETVVSYDVAPAMGMQEISLTPYLRGNYFFSKKSVDLAGNTADQAYLADWSVNLGVRAARAGKWSADLYLTASGPAEVNAGFLQNANTGLANLTRNEEIPGYGLLNFAASWQITDQLTFTCGVNNILDKNYNPYYIPINDGSTADVAPWLLPGTVSGEGISAPGREFFGGLTWRF